MNYNANGARTPGNAPPTGQAPHYPDRFKTALCNQYAKTGVCDFNERCPFAHGVAELRRPASFDPLYTNAAHSVHLPPTSVSYNQKASLCKHYMADRKCQYNDTCGFAHGVPELRDHLKYKKNPCLDFQENGRCPFNLLCAYLHDETPEQLDELRAGKTFFEAGVIKLQIDRDGRPHIRLPNKRDPQLDDRDAE